MPKSNKDGHRGNIYIIESSYEQPFCKEHNDWKGVKSFDNKSYNKDMIWLHSSLYM